MRLSPSKSPEQNPVVPVTPYLDAIHVPLEHRLNVWVRDVDILRLDHHVMFWRAVHNYFTENGLTAALLPENDIRGLSEWEVNIVKAVEWDEMALEFFGRRCEQRDGYGMLENMLNDEDFPKAILRIAIDGMKGSNRDTYDKLREDVRKSLPSAEVRGKRSKELWNYTVSRSGEVDKEDGERGVGRYIKTSLGVMEGVEQDPSRVWNSQARASLDLRVAHCISMEKVAEQTSEATMFIPNSDGRWMMKSKGCTRQQLHTDLDSVLNSQDLCDDKNPGYFGICTGDQEAPLWLVCVHIV